MLKVKVILILICIPLAGLAAYYAAWVHQQHARVAAVSKAADRINTHEAQTVQQYNDR